MSEGKIPQVRAEIMTLVERLETTPAPDPLEVAETLRELERRLYRRRPVRKGPIRNRLTPEQVHDIRLLANADPDALYMEIAHTVGCSIGRVSEVLSGHR